MALVKKRQKRGQETWKWVTRWNVLDDKTKEERETPRWGIMRGRLGEREGEVVKIDLYECGLEGE